MLRDSFQEFYYIKWEKMKKIIITVIIFLTISNWNILEINAALNDFKKDYEKEESGKAKTSGEKSDDSTGSDSSKSYSDSNQTEDCFSQVIGDFCTGFFLSWITLNYHLKYAYYPYQTKDTNNFIYYFLPDDTVKTGEDAVINPQPEIKQNESSSFTGWLNHGIPGKSKDFYFAFDAGGQYAFGNGSGAFLALSGKIFKFIGPLIEVKRIWDGKDYLGQYAFGVNFPLCQFSGFMPDIYIQKIFLKGVLDRSGIGYGFILNSFPVKPLSFMIRIGMQSYGNIKGQKYGSMDFYDYEARIGFLINRYELFAGYKHLKAERTTLEGPVMGIRIFI